MWHATIWNFTYGFDYQYMVVNLFSFGRSQILTFFGPCNERSGGDYYMLSTVVMVLSGVSVYILEGGRKGSTS